MVKNILSNLKFKCKNGCDIQIPYTDLREHYEEKCPKLDFKPKYESLLSQFNKLKITVVYVIMIFAILARKFK